MKKIILLNLIFAGIFFFNSCKTENEPEDPNKPDNPSQRYAVVNLLNDNSGYEALWDTTMDVRVMNTVISGSLGVSDFTVDTKNRMNFVFYQVLPSQQSTFYQSYRRTWDLTNKTMIPQNPLAAKESVLNRYLLNYQADHALVFELYKPYTNYYTAGILTSEGGSIQYNRVYFQGDMYTDDTAFSSLSRLELGYENAVGQSTYNEAVIFRGLNKKDNEDFNYKYSAITLDYAIFQYVVPNIITYYMLCEARTNGPSVYFGFTRNDEIQAIEFTETGNLGMPTLKGTKGTITATVKWTPYVKWVTQAFVYPQYQFGKSIRHYNVDGSIMTFAMTNSVTGNYTTFMYNFNTKSFKKVLDDVSLTYGDRNSSDVDIDEEGNLYYTGYANNGTNQKGISVYKISAGGNHSLVGADNFLKFGTVIKLKYLHGKVYLCVTGKKTGYDVHQISFIRTK